MFSSTRKCCPSSFFARTVTQPECGRRVLVDTPCEVLRGLVRACPRATRPCARRTPARSACRAPAAARGRGSPSRRGCGRRERRARLAQLGAFGYVTLPANET
jgi:hypothetical protein